MAFIAPDSIMAHLLHGLKTGLAAIMAYAAAELFHLQYGYWAALSAVIVMQINVADSLRMCWYRFSGTAVGAIIGIIAIKFFPDTPVMTGVALFLSVAFCAYMTRHSNRYKMAAITVTIVLLASLGEPNRVIFGLMRVVEIAIGVGCAFLVSVFMLPQRVGVELDKRLTERFAVCSGLYQQLMECFLSLQRPVDPALVESFQASLRNDRALFQKVLSHERMIYRDDTALFSLKLRTLERCAGHMQAMQDALNSHSGKGYEIIMKKELRELAAATTLAMQSAGVGIAPKACRLDIALARSEDKLGELRDEGATKRFYLQKLTQFFAFYHGAYFLGQDMLRYATDPMVMKTEKYVLPSDRANQDCD